MKFTSAAVRLLGLSKVNSVNEATKELNRIGVFLIALGLSLFFLRDGRWVQGLVIDSYGFYTFVFVLGGYSLAVYRSRTVAAVLLLHFLIVANNRLQAVMMGHAEMPMLVFFSAVSLASLRSLYVTITFHRHDQSRVLWGNLLLKSILTVVYYALFFLVMAYLASPLVENAYHLGEAASKELLFQWMLNADLVVVFLVFGGWLPLTYNRPVCR